MCTDPVGGTLVGRGGRKGGGDRLEGRWIGGRVG